MTVLFKTGDSMKCMYILVEGEIETYLQVNDDSLILDVIDEPGSIFGEAAMLWTKEAINCCARISKQAKMIKLQWGMINGMA